MEEFYRLNRPIISSSNTSARFHGSMDNMLQFEEAEPEVGGSEMMDLIKTQISNHPLYPNLVSAYIECQKVGAPPEIASLLEEINRGNHYALGSTYSEIGANPELDEFMDAYCKTLYRYKDELSKPFDEATTFLSGIESQLNNLCKGTLDYRSDEATGTSGEELSYGEVDAAAIENQELSSTGPSGDSELKEKLLRKYSGYLSNLMKEFLKKRKKGKLPKDATVALMDWWNTHYRWPYPTEEEKSRLSEVTGLDQKQISNWFINQRKRHWKPSEDMRFALMDDVSSSAGGPIYFDPGDRTGR